MLLERAAIEINLDNLLFNIEKFKRNLSKDCKIMAIVKADAYGHGGRVISQYLEVMDEIWGFGVATVEEGIALRKEGIYKDILVLGATFPEEIKKSITYNLTSNVFTLETASLLDMEARKRNKICKIHISIDSGMGRIGFRNNKKDINDIIEISRLKNIKIKGIFTHFSKADEEDLTYTLYQMEYFNKMVETLEEKGIYIEDKHVSNSAAISDKIGTDLNIVRAGISMYGIYPDFIMKDKIGELRPLLSLRCRVIFIKEVEEGTSISYGGTFISNKKMKVATISIGYGDGIPRTLSNKGKVIIKGKEANVLGRICMDQLMVDITNIDGVEIGDIVTIIGRDADKEISLESLSNLSGRFHYELLCDLNKRLPICYYEKGEHIKTEYRI